MAIFDPDNVRAITIFDDIIRPDPVSGPQITGEQETGRVNVLSRSPFLL